MARCQPLPESKPKQSAQQFSGRFSKEQIMQPLKLKQIVKFKWCIAVLVAISSVMILVSTASQAQHENGSGKIVGTAAGTDAASQVMIDNFVYNPVPLTIKVGTTVTWINHDDIPHKIGRAHV